MQYKANLDPRKIIGRRPNLAEQNTVADEIVSVLSVPPEDMPLPPLSPLPPTTPSPARKRNPRIGAVAGTILVFLPLLYPLVFFIHGSLIGYPMPAWMYPYLVLIARYLSNIGGLFLYLSARSASFLRKPIGWVSFASFALPLIGSILLGGLIYSTEQGTISQTRGWIGICCLAVALLCMLALCVFSVLLLIRVFPKKEPQPAE